MLSSNDAESLEPFAQPSCRYRDASEARMSLTAGAKLGCYEILGPLGAGGMGEVYRAKDTRLQREAAIKILPAELSQNQDRLTRFEREARTASALNHPNIVTIYDIGSADSCTYIAMELIDGKTLRASGALPLTKILNVASQIADGLAKAHAAGIIHRDLKPENLMITKDGFAKILDFGLAKLMFPSAEGVSQEETGTRSGTILGTVAYMSPEQAGGESLDFRSDQFSFGTILYELISGKHPFRRKTAAQTFSAILKEDPPSLTQAPAPLCWVIERCLAKDPGDRYESTRDLAKEIQTVRDHFSKAGTTAEIQPVARRKSFWKIWGVTAAVVLVTFAALLLSLRKTAPLSASGPGPSYHRLSYRHGYISTARFAPDGQTIVYSGAFDGSPRELFLTRTEGVESHPLGISGADVLSISPAGQMAILLRKEIANEPEGQYTGMLAEVPLAGGGPRELAEQVSAACWTPDGSKLAIVRRIAGRSRLEFPPGRLLYESTRLIRQPHFSPKGDLIAFGKFPHDSVVIVDLHGKTVAQSKAAWPDGIAWAPKSNEVWFTTVGAEVGSGSELHALAISGKQRLIQQFPAIANLGDISANGRLLMTFDNFSRIAITLRDHDEQNVSWLDGSNVAGLSPDGKSIAIYEDSQASEAPLGSTYFRKTDGSPAIHLGAGVAVDLSRDGKFALSYLPDPFRFVLFPTGPGETKVLKIDRLNVRGDEAALSPDGKQIIFGADDPPHGIRVYSQLIAGGQPRALTPEGVDLFGPVSADGKFFIGRTKDNKLFSYALGSGVTRPIAGVREGELPLQWSDDGASVYVYTPNVLSVEVYRVNTLNGQRTFVKKLTPLDPAGVAGIGSMRMTPDGKTFAYSYPRTLSTLYLIDGLK